LSRNPDNLSSFYRKEPLSENDSNTSSIPVHGTDKTLNIVNPDASPFYIEVPDNTVAMLIRLKLASGFCVRVKLYLKHPKYQMNHMWPV